MSSIDRSSDEPKIAHDRCEAWCVQTGPHPRDSHQSRSRHVRRPGNSLYVYLERPWVGGWPLEEVTEEHRTPHVFVYDEHDDDAAIRLTAGQARSLAAALIAMAELDDVTP